MLNLPRIEYNQSLENVIKSFEIQEKSFGRLMAISEYYFPHLKKSLQSMNVP
jgi:membrane-bound lytic murein transglycosylase D